MRVRWRFAEAPDCHDGPCHETAGGVCVTCGLQQTQLLHWWWYWLWLLHGENAEWRADALYPRRKKVA